MIGSNAGYLAAGQAGAVLFFGLIGGIWADHWDPKLTMIKVDLLRVDGDVQRGPRRHQLRQGQARRRQRLPLCQL